MRFVREKETLTVGRSVGDIEYSNSKRPPTPLQSHPLPFISNWINKSRFWIERMRLLARANVTPSSSVTLSFLYLLCTRPGNKLASCKKRDGKTARTENNSANIASEKEEERCIFLLVSSPWGCLHLLIPHTSRKCHCQKEMRAGSGMARHGRR